MSHEPPVPPGNTSPYPIAEPPHPPAPPEAPPRPTTESHGWPIAGIIGAVATIGAVAVGAVALLRPRKEKPKPRRKRKQKA